MQLIIDISSADAAAIWVSNWGAKSGRTLTQMVQETIETEAKFLRRQNPECMPAAVAQFRAESVEPLPRQPCAACDRRDHQLGHSDACQTLLNLQPSDLILS